MLFPVGGIVSWLMECMSERSLTPEELGVTQHPVFSPEGFNVVSDSMHNADIGMALLDSIIQGRGILNLEQGARKFARQLSRDKGKGVLDSFVYIAFAQGVDGAQPVLDTGRAVAYGYHGKILYVLWQRLPAAAQTGSQKCRATAERVDIGQHGHVSLSQGVGRRDDPGDCRIPVWPEAGFLESISITAGRINSRNASVFWESDRAIDYVYTFLKRKQTVEGQEDPELVKWIDRFEADKHEAALSFWYDMHKGTLESLREFWPKSGRWHR